MLRDLLNTWETWSAQQTLSCALSRMPTGQERDGLIRNSAATPEVDPLAALRDSTELVSLLQSWQWQAVRAARAAGASWSEIAAATGTTGDQARVTHVAALDRSTRNRI